MPSVFVSVVCFVIVFFQLIPRLISYKFIIIPWFVGTKTNHQNHTVHCMMYFIRPISNSTINSFCKEILHTCTWYCMMQGNSSSGCPLFLMHMQLDIYLAFIEEVLQYTCEEHMDYIPLGSALEALQGLKQVVLHF